MTHFLFIDDDAVERMTAQRAFKKNNIANPLSIADNGLKVLAILGGDGSRQMIPNQHRPVLLARNRSKMGALEFLPEWRTDLELTTIPVVVLTTLNEEKDKVDVDHLNVAGYKVNSVNFSKFAEVIAGLNRY